MIKPVLIFAYGNPSRGDDALAPVLSERLQQTGRFGTVDFLVDFQLQIEHALDLQQRQLVLFADASVSGSAPFSWRSLSPQADDSYTTHAMTPAALLQVYCEVLPQSLPACFMLSIRGEQFELGKPLSDAAEDNLQRAEVFCEQLLNNANLDYWQKMTAAT